MNAFFLRLCLVFLLTSPLVQGLWAQNTRFVYIQTENKQPFYVKMDAKILNSSATGYIILSQLSETSNPLTIGFPQNEWPELNVTVHAKDAATGYLLKKSEDKSWDLIDLESGGILTTTQDLPAIEEVEIESIKDEFARVLAQVVNDPSIARAVVVKNTVDPIVIKTAAPTVKETTVTETPEQQIIKSEKDNSGITKLLQDSTSSGLLISYKDSAAAATDTVKVFIPVTQIQESNDKTISETPAPIKKDSRFIDMELQNPNQKIDSGAVQKNDFVITEKKAVLVNKAEPEPATKDLIANNKPMINSGCKKAASQNDFLQLRKNMAAVGSELDMRKVATKQFVKTCFTTDQIKNLGVLFINEEERYKFYVAAFPFVSDTQNFGNIEDQLTNNDYKARFKAMLNQ